MFRQAVITPEALAEQSPESPVLWHTLGKRTQAGNQPGGVSQRFALLGKAGETLPGFVAGAARLPGMSDRDAGLRWRGYPSG
jgi:hypothetical protein